MKLICLDQDECGASVKISASEEYDNICPVCFGVAVIYTDTYKPLIHKTFDETTDQELNSILVHVHNLINQELGSTKQIKHEENKKKNKE